MAKVHQHNLCGNPKCSQGEEGKRKGLGHNILIYRSSRIATPRSFARRNEICRDDHYTNYLAGDLPAMTLVSWTNVPGRALLSAEGRSAEMKWHAVVRVKNAKREKKK
jgi:hypothetical protein